VRTATEATPAAAAPRTTAGLRIVHVITKLDIGGAQETAVRCCSGLLARGHEVTLVSGWHGGGAGPMADRARAEGVDVVELPSLVRAIRPWSDLMALVALARLLRRLRPDVVHSHSSKAGVLARLAARLAGVPVVCHTVHGWSFRDEQPRVVRSAVVLLERLLASVTTATVVVTSADLDLATRHRIGRADRFSLIRSGVRLAAFRDGDRQAGRSLLGVADEPLVGAVQRLAAPKDTRTLLEAVAKARAEVPGLRLVVVGDGPDRGDVERMVVNLGLEGAVDLLGSRDDVPSLVAAFDVAVLSSRSEGLPRAVVEYMAAGVPVVASDVGGVPEVVHPGETGWLVPAGDAGAMAAAIVAALEGPDAARVAATGQASVADFDEAEMVRLLDELYTRSTAP
jgi:glycosyltransferase involved in cell wall biosynthesis